MTRTQTLVLLLLTGCSADATGNPNGAAFGVNVSVHTQRSGGGADCSVQWLAIANDPNVLVDWQLENGSNASGTWGPGVLTSGGAFRGSESETWLQPGYGQGTISLRWVLSAGTWAKADTAYVPCGTNWDE